MVNSALIGRRTTISAAAFTGRATPPAAVVQSDPTTTTTLINRNSLQLGVVSNQIQNLSNQINSLSQSLQVVANGLATSRSLERQKEQQEILLERRLAEQQLREGKESAIEKKIQNKTIEPAERLSGRAQVTLGRLGNFFYTLLGGWLAINAIKVLNALSDGNKKELEKLQNKIVSNLIKIGAVMLGGKAALALLTLRFKAFALLATGAALANYFSDPIAQFINVVIEAAKRGIPGLLNLFTGNKGGNDDLGENSDSTTPPLEVTPSQNNPTIQSTEENQTNQQNQQNQQQEPPPDPTSPPQTGLGGPSLKPITPVMGRSPMSADDLTGNEEEPPMDFSQPAEYGETEMKINNVSIEGDPSAGLEPGQMKQGDTTLSSMGYSVDEVKNFINGENYIGKTGQLPTNMFTPMSRDNSVAKTISQSTEPEVTVVPIPIEQAQTQQSEPIQAPSAQGAVSGVPNIPTANEDNIYLLGAYSNFNVVPN